MAGGGGGGEKPSVLLWMSLGKLCGRHGLPAGP